MKKFPIVLKDFITSFTDFVGTSPILLNILRTLTNGSKAYPNAFTVFAPNLTGINRRAILDTPLPSVHIALETSLTCFIVNFSVAFDTIASVTTKGFNTDDNVFTAPLANLIGINRSAILDTPLPSDHIALETSLTCFIVNFSVAFVIIPSVVAKGFNVDDRIPTANAPSPIGMSNIANPATAPPNAIINPPTASACFIVTFLVFSTTIPIVVANGLKANPIIAIAIEPSIIGTSNAPVNATVPANKSVNPATASTCFIVTFLVFSTIIPIVVANGLKANDIIAIAIEPSIT